MPHPSDKTALVPLPSSTLSQRDRQWEKLRALLRRIASTDSFNSRRLRECGVEPVAITSLEDFVARVPLTVKADLLADRLAHPPFGSNFTEPFARYTRFCQTTGTMSGQPMAVLDTPASWDAMLTCWRQVYRAAGVKPGERIFFAFSFGPFLGFWTAFEAAARDCIAIPGGGLSSTARLEMMARYEVTTLCCTPTYAMRLGESIGVASGISLEQLKVKRIIVAGEPGGSLPTTRERLRVLWGGAHVFDHHGLTEIGPVSYEDPDHPASLCVFEEAYFAEVLDVEGREVPDGSEGELVLTTLARTGAPLLRYRTGDWVSKHLIGERLVLEGGVLGRTDDMAVIRGVNIYPSAVEDVLRRFPEVAEFQIEQRKVDAMDEVEVVVELNPDIKEAELADRLSERLRDTFSLRIPVRIAPPGSLPRFEFKARRWKKL
jgi:phenylacetate-CoA ligase